MFINFFESIVMPHLIFRKVLLIRGCQFHQFARDLSSESCLYFTTMFKAITHKAHRYP